MKKYIANPGFLTDILLGGISRPTAKDLSLKTLTYVVILLHNFSCEHCIDCFFLDRELPKDGGRELCILDPDHPVEVNYSDKACSRFELSDTAAEKRRKAPGEL